MRVNGCLSVLDDCTELCAACAQSHQRAVTEAGMRIVREAVAALESRGWKLTPPVEAATIAPMVQPQRKWTWRGSDKICGCCGGVAVTYVDATCGPLGDFRFCCLECVDIVAQEVSDDDAVRHAEHLVRKEWNANYTGVPVDEL